MKLPADHEFDARLIDYHLGVLSAAQRREVEQALAADAQLAGEHEALTGVFGALASLRTAPDIDAAAPQRITGKIMQRVRSAGPAPRVTRANDLAETQNAIRIIPLHSLREIIAVAAMVVLAVGIGIPGMVHMRDRSQRALCSWNLGQIGQAMQSYATAYNGALPFAGWTDNASWRPTPEPDVDLLPNRQHMFPLVREQRVASNWLVCPSQRDVPLPQEQIRLLNGFPEPRNVSYAYQNMAGRRPSLNDHADLPVLADDNPLFENGMPILEAVARRFRDPASYNSRAHGGSGQNLLTVSGHTRWSTTPNTGVNGDNIWTLSNVNHYTGREGPRVSTDSHLLK